MFGLFEGGEGRFARDGGKTLYKFFKGFSARNVVEQSLDGHSGAAEHRSSAEDVRIFDDDVHERIGPRATGKFVSVRTRPLAKREDLSRLRRLVGMWHLFDLKADNWV